MHESSGLRFDIYERVHLPQEAADIREIEEIELTPCVQAERRGDQVVLRGSLLLGGVYLPDDESRGLRQLEHWIPVEITLPQERVGRLEDLAVEVDNFDVDLLDKRTLNITGVLMLQGVEAGPSAGRQQAYAWGEEPYTVVHRRGREDPEEAAPELSGDAARTGEEAEMSFALVGGPAPDETADPAGEQAAWRGTGEPDALDAAGAAAGEAAEDASASDPAAEAVEAGSAEPEQPAGELAPVTGPVEWKAFAARAEESAAATGEAAAEDAKQPPSDSDPAPASEPAYSAAEAAEDDGAAVRADSAFAQEESPSGEAAGGDEPADSQPREPLAGETASSVTVGAQPASGKADLRVAFGAKRDDVDSGAEGTPGPGKLFFPERREARAEAGLKAQAQEAAEPEQPREPADAGQRQAVSDEADWKNLFRGAAAQESFRTVRLCIVQKDDTLDAIAMRYQRNPREIALANRLDGTPLTEGQVLYIP